MPDPNSTDLRARSSTSWRGAIRSTPAALAGVAAATLPYIDCTPPASSCPPGSELLRPALIVVLAAASGWLAFTSIRSLLDDVDRLDRNRVLLARRLASGTTITSAALLLTFGTDIAGLPAVALLALPELMFTILDGSGWKELALRLISGTAALLPGLVAGFVGFVLGSAILTALPSNLESSQLFAITGFGFAYAAGHMTVFYLATLVGRPPEHSGRHERQQSI